jgi:hypothetical protein
MNYKILPANSHGKADYGWWQNEHFIELKVSFINNIDKA